MHASSKMHLHHLHGSSCTAAQLARYAERFDIEHNPQFQKFLQDLDRTFGKDRE